MARADTVMTAIRWKPELHERLAQPQQTAKSR